MANATGGTERTVLEIARIQQRRGFDVTIASRGDEYWQGRWENVKLIHLASYSWLKTLSFGRITGIHIPLTFLIYKNNFNILHFHEYGKTRFLENYPKVAHFHNDPLAGRDDGALAREAPPYWARAGRSLRQIGVSNYSVGRLRHIHKFAGPGAPGAHIVRIPNGVHADAVPPPARPEMRKRTREKLGLKESSVVFLFVGALRPEKGVEFLAHAFAKLAQENADAVLIVAGGGRLWIEPGWLKSDGLDAMDRKIAQVLDAAIQRGRALLLGIVPPSEIMAYYTASDVLVLPSMFQETFGLVILEAFSVGVPVIAFRSGGVPELVEDRRNGLIVEQGDGEGLYQAMRELAEDRSLRERLGAAGERIVAQYSWENTASQVEAVYLSALQSRSRGAGRSLLPKQPR